MSRISKGHQRKIVRQEAAAENEAARTKRSPQQQLDLLNERLGEDIGATRERKHLQKLLANSKKEKK